MSHAKRKSSGWVFAAYEQAACPCVRSVGELTQHWRIERRLDERVCDREPEMEVEDSLGQRAPGIEGRFARKHLDSEHLGVSYLRYSPGVRSSSAHSHREQEEAYVVISGSGRVRLDDEIHDLQCWDVVRVNPATVRAFEAGDHGLELIAIGSDRPDGGDGVPAARSLDRLSAACAPESTQRVLNRLTIANKATSRVG